MYDVTLRWKSKIIYFERYLKAYDLKSYKDGTHWVFGYSNLNIHWEENFSTVILPVWHPVLHNVQNKHSTCTC